MTEFLKQFAFLMLDVLVGVLRSVSSDMKHSITARVKEQVVKRDNKEPEPGITISDINCRQYKILYLNKDLLILKKTDDIVCEVPVKDKIEPQLPTTER